MSSEGQEARQGPNDELGFRTVDDLVPGALSGERIDRVVAFMADVSRREAVELIGVGKVLINGSAPSKPSLRVSTDDQIVVKVPQRAAGPQADPDVPVSVVHVDDHVLVIEKPIDVVIHPGSGTPDKTLVNGLLAQFPELMGVGEAERPGIVHRLDKGTTGLLMVARTQQAYESLVAQLADRSVVRRYRTAVEGLVANEEGLIDAPLGRSPRQAIRRAVVADGSPARTRYRVEHRYDRLEISVLTCRLETGRTHQIRAHLEAIGHPVLGDTTYGAQVRPGLKRPFLHAELLGFTHPATGAKVEFVSELAPDLEAMLTELHAAESEQAT